MTAIGRLRGLLLLALLLALAGCKKPKPTQAEADEGPSREQINRGIGNILPSVQRVAAGADLRTLAHLYNIDAQAGTPPKKVEDLKELDAKTVKAIKEGEVVVLWNASANTTPGTAVIAYEKDVPTRGGMVATFSGSVIRMTPEEFKAAPKAKGR
jgi:hypothetical protein